MKSSIHYYVEVQISKYIRRSVRFSNYSSVIDYLENIFDTFPVQDVSIKVVRYEVINSNKH